jgi:hypothetical protein
VNNYVAQNVVLGQTFTNELLTALTLRPAAAIIAAGKLRLSHDPAFNPTSQSTIAALAANEVNYSGYPAGGLAAVISGAVNQTPQKQAVIVNGLFEATPAGPFVPDQAYGWWIDDGTNFVAGEAFPGHAAAGFANPGDYLDLTAIIPIGMILSTN